MPNALDQLDAEWQHITEHHTAVPRRWRTNHRCLDLFGELDDLVRFVNRRQQPAASDEVLAALAHLAGSDQLAARTLLQAVMPALKTITAAHLWAAEHEDIAAHVTAIAWDRVRSYPIDRRPARIAANIVLDVRQRLRRELRPLPHDPFELAAHDRAGGHDPSAGEQLLAIVTDALASGVIDVEEANLITQTRIHGVSWDTLATRTGHSTAALKKRRIRAERQVRRTAA